MQVTRHAGLYANESKDGKSFYYERHLPGPSVWKAPVLGGKEALLALGARTAGLIGSPMGQGPYLVASALIASEGSKVLELPKGAEWFSWALDETSTGRGIYFTDPSGSHRSSSFLT